MMVVGQLDATRWFAENNVNKVCVYHVMAVNTPHYFQDLQAWMLNTHPPHSNTRRANFHSVENAGGTKPTATGHAHDAPAFGFTGTIQSSARLASKLSGLVTIERPALAAGGNASYRKARSANSSVGFLLLFSTCLCHSYPLTHCPHTFAAHER